MVRLCPSLIERLTTLAPLAIAYSGGIDSRFLAHASKLLGLDVVLLHASGPHIPKEESDYALSWAAREHFALKELSINVLEDANIKKNAKRRCYFCKKVLFSQMQNLLLANNEGGRTLVDGSNFDDRNQYRPGLQALKELGIVSPLKDAGLTKAAIRSFARQTGLEFPEQHASPCLLTRLAYGITPTISLLQNIAATEGKVRAYLERDGKKRELRLRITPAPILQVSQISAEERLVLRDILAQCGFPFLRLCQGPSISGFFDRDPLLGSVLPYL